MSCSDMDDEENEMKLCKEEKERAKILRIYEKNQSVEEYVRNCEAASEREREKMLNVFSSEELPKDRDPIEHSLFNC